MSVQKNPASRPSVFVLDPGLRDHRTHHHVINRNLATHAPSLGATVGVAGHRRAVPADFSYPVTPVFQRGLYKDSPALAAGAFETLVADHARDLSRCLAATQPAAVAVHTVTAAFLQALGVTLMTGDHRVGSAVIQLMFHPLGLAVGDVAPDASLTRYAQAFASLRAAERACGTRIHLSTSCREFVEVFETLGAGRVDVHPAALLAEAERTAWLGCRPMLGPTPGSARRTAFLYGGDLKLDKGLAWVAAALPTLLAAHPDIDFTVHLGDNRFADPHLDRLRRQVIETSGKWPHLEVVQGHVVPATWDRLLAMADVLLLPYDPCAYRWKTSGIFWEMLLKRRPGAVLAATRGTWMERESCAEGLDVALVEYGDTAAVTALLQRVAGAAAVAPPGSQPPSCLWQGNDDYILKHLGFHAA